MRLFSKLVLHTGWVVFCILLIAGCFSHPRVKTVVHEGQEGSVYLREFSDPSFRANHPLTLDSQVVKTILLGIRVHERKTMIESTLTGGANATPVFTFAEVTYLTPHLVSAFEQATAGEEVNFQINGEVSGRRFDTGGVMYVTGNNVNLSLNEYGLTPKRSGTLSQPTQSFDRPRRWTVTFTPISAVLNGEEEKQVIGKENVPQTFLLSLDILQRYTLSTPEGDAAFDTDHETSPIESQYDQSTGTTQKAQSQEEMEEEIRNLRESMKKQEERLKRLEGQMEK